MVQIGVKIKTNTKSLTKNMKKKALLFLKIGISAVLLYLIFLKIPFSEVSQTLLKAHWGYLGLGTLFFFLSKIPFSETKTISFVFNEA